MQMKALRIIAAGGILTAWLFQVRADPPNGISAVVHDSVITYDEVDVATAQTAETLSRQYRNQPDQFEKKMNEARSDNLKKLLDRQLILHEFKTAGYNLPETIVDEVVRERIRARYRDRSTFTKSLQEEGLTYERFRQQVRDQFILEALRQKNISSEIIISPHKVETYYEAHKDDFKMEDEVKLRIIVLTNAIPAQRREMGVEVVRKIKEGAAFEEMANIYSAPRQAKGSVETFRTSSLRKELADATSKLKAGQVSDVIETPEACYVIKIEEARPAHFKSLSEVRDEIERDLKASEQARLERQWIDRLKKKTFVRYF
jgi:peptidyl-prolyl cis-trans isomerase SurA